MLAVISPAKRLDELGLDTSLGQSRPQLLDDATQLAALAAKYNAAGLAKLMHLSDALAALNVSRFSTWKPDPTHDVGRQALRLFAGDTYVGLDASTLDAASCNWAQSHLAILSGLYGVLRPLDIIAPYRLEMGTRLPNTRGRDLYAWWGDKIGSALREQLHAHQHKVLIVLASQEYARAIQVDALGYPVIDVRFLEEKDGEARVIGLYAKQARGLMARMMIEDRLEDPEQLKAFDREGYRFVAGESTATQWVFKRPQPKPLRAKN